MEIMKACCSEVNLNLESLSNCNFLNEIFFLILFIILVKNWYILVDKNNFNFVLCYEIIRIVYFCVKTAKRTNLLHFMEVLCPKNLKVAKIWKTYLLFYGCHDNGDDIPVMISNYLQQEFRKSHQIWKKTDKHSTSGEHMCPLVLYRVKICPQILNK